ncbi:hypothetical protein BaRGS_00021506 [Batillaria attramentaria]|uniref:ShKT domain-containing protein n=1 Tax=Batillaria attramentaria TaxID=370345 RepID=A0ABD0KJT4_9CAEN
MLNPALCEPTLPQTDVQHALCNYCCDSAECLQNLVHQTTAVAATTTPRPNSPGMNSCFSTDCNPGDDIDTCSSGTWECEAGEFCQVHYSFSAKSFTMNCTKSTWLNFEECQQKLLNHHCSNAGGFNEHDCHFCCPDAHCVELIKDVETAPPKTTLPPCAPLQQTTPASQSSSTQSPSSGTPSLSTLLTSPPTSQAGTTSQDISTSPSTSQTRCRDMLAGDCAAKYFDQCDNAVVRYHMCQLTCNACNETPPDTHLTTTPQGCRDMLAGDCAAKYFDQCDNAVVRYHMCQLTCNACNGQCADCYGLDCLLSDPSKPCPGEKPFCMTIVQETSHGRDIKRVCADQQDCDSITLTSDCHLVEDKILAGVTCEYCCNEPDCNAPPDLVPKKGLMTQHPKP